jgi:hypothetical protein
MKINFTKKQYESLIMMSQLSEWVLGILGDSIDSEKVNYKKLSLDNEELEKYILSFTKDFGMTDKIEHYEDDIFLNEDESEKYQEIIEEYDDYVFWNELENRLARRDFYQTMTKLEKKESEEADWLPDRFRDIEERYRKEFEENGIDRLEIKKN